ncbi:4-carboxy-4-hydroxy-2-oxoadipate aldolase/oxaloacetate decarboxylase [Micrococcus sp. GPGPB33]|uniref:4-carboxy-4-hydroxy-2-oxoadipate aldolase/oxaloacetate decarboxylase n=1 Tax=Micrococcus sp. GPGPB33 TaxID=3023084 RepID=UPI0030BC0B0F|nr:4-carboxy-4-hydroxy-2-oxoadipate aldolase/oxaloacetate decarboxylase [Micrococcus luteus]MCV7606090.1 4-carboxy-4-hydroxy-2-oxoadipate aldolase/oxaloacetate decarboxylase [Micrococcus luteus]MCV7672557.1 4-carboxy-4-hydroxy-2-oxoadipate aldolase/oxaloacetate decarboxylase [Micrococcus luteus]MCV7691633.1 4-carboxy-4-hydroxy-2-oxoadipate aldolase/oxaloacetate decarboxylase [Micrococcus luteus]MCV7708253.1 4-carboxy-4-hydroxy-2-oxoadipate aldolase/oxaloacetate decarboxylase [Micrococcus luteus
MHENLGTTLSMDHHFKEFQALGAATVYEASGQEGALDSGIKPVNPASRMCGRAITLELDPADNWYIHVALLQARPGDVLVIDAQGFLEAGAWGDVLTLAAQERGLHGLVIDGSVRDAQDIIDAGFPVYSRGISIKGTTKARHGRINVPIRVGGVLVKPGDLMIGDRDGVCRVEANRITEVLEASKGRAAKEEGMRRKLRQGASTLELLALENPERDDAALDIP